MNGSTPRVTVSILIFPTLATTVGTGEGVSDGIAVSVPSAHESDHPGPRRSLTYGYKSFAW